MPHLSGRHTSRDPDTVNLIGLLMEAVIGHLIDHIEQDEYGAGQANGKTENIDQGIALLSPQISQGNKNVVL